MLRLTLVFAFIAMTASAQAARTLRETPASLTTDQGMLYGSLLSPVSSEPTPVALLIAGSGPTDRNGNNPQGHNDSLKKLAYALAQRGIASLRYDKRGIAASRAATPDERNLTVDGYVADAIAWSQLLENDQRFSRLFLVGHSEGALIASLAASRTRASGLIMVAPAGRPVARILLEQLEKNAPRELLEQGEMILERLNSGQYQPDVPRDLQILFRPSVQPYLISLLRQRPAQALARVEVPVLIIQGNHDIQVSEHDAQLLKQAKPNARLIIIPGMNHVMRITPASWAMQADSYNDPARPLAKALTEHIIEFISQPADGTIRERNSD